MTLWLITHEDDPASHSEENINCNHVISVISAGFLKFFALNTFKHILLLRVKVNVTINVCVSSQTLKEKSNIKEGKQTSPTRYSKTIIQFNLLQFYLQWS